MPSQPATIDDDGDLTVDRLGYGAMHLTGEEYARLTGLLRRRVPPPSTSAP